MTCDCTALTANKNYYQAAITYDTAAQTLANTELMDDESSYSAALSAWEACGCAMMAEYPADAEKPKIEPFPVDDALLKKFAEEREELKKKHIQQMLSQGN